MHSGPRSVRLRSDTQIPGEIIAFYLAALVAAFVVACDFRHHHLRILAFNCLEESVSVSPAKNRNGLALTVYDNLA